MQTGHCGNNGECSIQTHREPIYWQMLCEVSISLSTCWVMEALSSHLDCLSAASAALVVILFLVHINNKNIFQLNLLNPRWCSTLLVTLSLSQIASHSIRLQWNVLPKQSSAVPRSDSGYRCDEGRLWSSTIQKTALQLSFSLCVQLKYLMLWVSL